MPPSLDSALEVIQLCTASDNKTKNQRGAPIQYKLSIAAAQASEKPINAGNGQKKDS